MIPGGVRVARQSVQDEDGVAAVGVKLAVGFVGQGNWPQRFAAIQRHRLVLSKGKIFAFNQSNRVIIVHCYCYLPVIDKT